MDTLYPHAKESILIPASLHIRNKLKIVHPIPKCNIKHTALRRKFSINLLNLKLGNNFGCFFVCCCLFLFFEKGTNYTANVGLEPVIFCVCLQGLRLQAWATTPENNFFKCNTKIINSMYFKDKIDFIKCKHFFIKGHS